MVVGWITLVLVVVAVGVGVEAASGGTAVRSRPAAPSWSIVPSFGLSRRADPVVVWDGHDVLVWGGRSGGGDSMPEPIAPLDAGYDPQTHRWFAISAGPIALPRGGAQCGGAWTGTHLLVYCGDVAFGDAASYDPATDRWAALPPAPLGGRDDPAVVWDGRALIVWGGLGEGGDEALGDGAAFDPATGRWARLPTAPIARWDATVVWDGKEMLVWGGATGGPRIHADGAAFDPSTGIWRMLPPSPLGPRYAASGVWTGKELVVWGGSALPQFQDDGAAFDPVTGKWRMLPAAPIDARSDAVAVWTGTTVLVWGGEGSPSGFVRARGDGAAYDPVRHSWVRLPASPLEPRVGAGSTWTPEGLFVWGGDDQPTASVVDDLSDGALYRP